MIRDEILPALARELNMGWHLEGHRLDAVLFHKTTRPYASYLSVAIEHENDCRTSSEEMHTLQRFNVPLTVLITYPGSHERGQGLLHQYAGIICDADVFQNATTHRRQLVIFGYPGPEWEAFVYTDVGFTPLDAAAAQHS